MPAISSQQKTLDNENRMTIGCESFNSSIISIASNVERVKNECLLTKKNKSIKSRIISFFKIKKMGLLRTSKLSHLIGKTVHPEIASKSMNKIQFTGTGKIINFKKWTIKKTEYDLLVDNMIKSLSETPHIVKNRIRTPGEVMIDIASLIQTIRKFDKNKVELESLIKCNWLDGTLSHKSISSVIEKIRLKIGDNPVIIEEVNKIVSSLENEVFITKRNDNYYGRLFETELSKYIIDTPNSNMMKVRDAISTFIINDFTKMPYNKQKHLCEFIAVQMFEDRPAWRYDLSPANAFMDSEEPKKFIEMMNFTGKYSILLVLSVAIKYIIKAKGMASIMNEATKYYLNEINRQRNLIESISSNEQLISEVHGLLLPYQKNISSDYETVVGLGIRPIDKYQRPIVNSNLTEHDAIALSSERAIGIGMSGSANLLHFLFRKLQLQDKDFPMDDAKLATASWLNYSGGHSFNEAYSSFGLMTRGCFKPISFNNISSTSELGENAVSHSYNKVLEASRRLKN